MQIQLWRYSRIAFVGLLAFSVAFLVPTSILAADRAPNFSFATQASGYGVHKFGTNPDIDTATDPQDVTELGGLYPFPSAASDIHFYSLSANDAAAGTGAQKLVIEALGRDWNLVSQELTMAGDTIVNFAVGANSDTAGRRVNRLFVTDVGSVGANDGAIYASVDNTTFVISDITQANPGVVTTTASHGFANGDLVHISGVVGMVEVNDRIFTVAGQTATTFQLSGENTTGFTAYDSVGIAEDQTLLATILAGRGQTLQAVYTIPGNASYGLLVDWQASIARTGGAAGAATFELLTRRAKDGQSWRIRDIEELRDTGGSSFSNERKFWTRLAPGTDVLIRVLSVTANDTGVSASFELYVHGPGLILVD